MSESRKNLQLKLLETVICTKYSLAICKMGSKFVTLGSKVFFFWAATFLFFEQQNYFFGSKSGLQKLFFWAARIIFLSSKNSYFEQQIFLL
jgi:hypothetical protein